MTAGYTKLDSSVIAGARYDPETATLDIDFTSGDRYRYYAVPPSVHRGLIAAPSAGRYFSAHIRDRYPTEYRPR